MAWSLFMGTLVGQPSDFNAPANVATDLLKKAICEVQAGKRDVIAYPNGEVFIEAGDGPESGYWIQFLADGRIEIGEPAA